MKWKSNLQAGGVICSGRHEGVYRAVAVHNVGLDCFSSIVHSNGPFDMEAVRAVIVNGERILVS